MLRKTGFLGMLCMVAVAASASAVPASLPAAQQELQDKILAFQKGRDCDGMKSIFYNDSKDEARKKAFGKTIDDYLCSNFSKAIKSIAFQAVPAEKITQPGEFEGKKSVYTLQPLGAVVLDYGSGQSGETGSISFLYGEHDGKDYLITTKNAD